MEIFNIWWVNVILYLIFAVVMVQFYKLTTKTVKKDGALTVILETIGGLTILLLSPFFQFKFPSDFKIYIFLFIATIFYAIADRLSTTVRAGIEASTYSILKQLSNAFMILGGLIIFKEPFVLTKILGATLIIFSNILIFYKKGKLKYNKYILLGILMNISMTIALFVDVSISNNFNLPIYVAITLIVPAFLIFIFNRIKISDIKEEFKNGNKKNIFITGISWGLMILSMLRAYQLKEVTTVAPLLALTVILNVAAGYIFLNERSSLIKKIIAAVMIIISVILIRL